ncbi:MAG: glutamate--tRNA ligase [Selenomonadaceae bacterium]|nr:glutamate--tRNA ligase [Selenomonadaceae bacterium]
MKVRTRFAPSPTGYMHIGNLRTALYAYLFAKKNKGDFILRIEDTDRARYVPDAVDFIKRTLKAANIVADEGPGIGGEFGPYVQSERMEIYKKYAMELIEKGAAYPCFCDDKREETANGEDNKFGGYNRACRDIPADEAKKRMENEPFVVRQKMPLTGETSYFDVLHGAISFNNEELEDQVLLKRDGMPTYNFANVIDDHLMEVTHIIRGAEFITSTPKHVLLYQALGWEPPAFIHLAPVMGKAADGSVSKLSKRHGATSFEDLANMGYLPEAIVNYVALLGWNPKNSTQEIFSMDELIEEFSLEGLSKSNSVFDYEKLGWMNGEYLKAMDSAKFSELAKPFAGDLGALEAEWEKIAALLKTRISRLDEIPAEIAFLKEMPPFDASLYINKRNKVTAEFAKEILPNVLELLETVPDNEWENDKLYEKLNAFITEKGYKKGAALWPIRISVSGKSATPGGATEILAILGKTESLARMKNSLQNLT